MLNGKYTPISWVKWGSQLRLMRFLIALAVVLLCSSRLMAAPAERVAYTVNPGCINLVPGGDFEQFTPAWQIQGSSRPPSYSIEQALNGVQSMRLGNGPELPDVESVSEVRHQPVLLPYGATSIILRFVYWPLYESTPGISDLQQADLFDAATDQLILPLLNVQDNKRAWKAVDYDLTSYAGREISLRFRVRNDGQPGRTLMYVDNVELEYCAVAPIPTYTPSPTPIATNTPTPTWTTGATVTTTPVTVTPSPTTPAVITVTPTAGMIPTADPNCPNILADPGFEGWGGWHFGEDPVPARHVSEPRLAGSYALQLGNPPGQQTNVKTFSSVRQLVTIPHDATRAELRWWKNLRTEQPGHPGPLTDRQDVVFLDPALNPLEVPRRELTNVATWREDYIDLTYYRGRTFYVYFNAFNDGNGARTWMYLDNVQLNVCGSSLHGGQRGLVVATPIAIPLTTVATFTQAPLPTPSPLPTQVVEPTSSATTLVPPETSTETSTAGINVETTAPSIAAVPSVTAVAATMEVQPTSNVYALPTPTASFVVETETPLVAPAESGVTVQPPIEVKTTPTTIATRPIWVDRLGPISVLLGVLVLIGFIVWAILRTFSTNRV